MYKKILCAVTVFLFSVSVVDSFASIQEDLESVAQSMRAVEDALLNVRIDSNSLVEYGPSSSGPWERTPRCWSTTAYYGKIQSSQVRIDFHKSVLPWKDGAAPYFEKSYSISFDGVQGRRKEISNSFDGKTFDKDTAFIFPKASALSQLRGFASITGVKASLFFHYYGMPARFHKRFSTGIEAAADDPNYFNRPIKNKAFFEKLGGTQCLKLVCSADTAPTRWWFDPGRGFALLRYEDWRKDQNGNERLRSSIDVTKL